MTTPGRAQQGPPTGALARWMWVFTTIGILVVVVVVGFLIAISNALVSINGKLGEATSSVQGIGRDVPNLPGNIQSINQSLSAIDESLKPISGQVGSINNDLQSIEGSLTTVDGSLKNTSNSLVDTTGSLVTISNSLVDTSNVLKSALSTGKAIEAELEAAQNRDNRGTNLIWRQVGAANSTLDSVQGDTSTITGQLQDTNQHLTTICESFAAQTVGGTVGGQTNC